MKFPVGGARSQGFRKYLSYRAISAGATPLAPTPSEHLPPVGQEKSNKHKHFGRDGVRDKQEPSLGQTGPLPGTNWDPAPGQTGLFLFNSSVKALFCSVCFLGRVGVRPWDDCPTGAVRKMFMCFLFIGFFFRPQPRPDFDLIRT